MISLDELIFDPANPNESSNVGAHILAGDDGTPIGHVGDALKVDIGTVTDLDIRDLDATQDNVAISDGTNTLVVNGDGSINTTTTISGTVDVTGSTVALDAPTLAALENITVTVDNSELEITNDVGNPIPISDAGGSITVDAVDLDIRDLTFATDSVDASGSEVKQDSYDNFKHSNQTITGTAAALAGTALTNRVNMLIQNLGSKDIYIGSDNTVTTSTGIKIPRGASAEFMFSAGSTPHAIADGGSADVRLLEMAY